MLGNEFSSVGRHASVFILFNDEEFVIVNAVATTAAAACHAVGQNVSLPGDYKVAMAVVFIVIIICPPLQRFRSSMESFKEVPTESFESRFSI